MMELTPLDVRKKKGDFRRGLRGYEPGVVDDFLDLVADRLETLVREAAASKEKVARLEQQVADYRDREKALTEALVTAQEMREEIRAQSAREVDLLRREAEQDAESIRGDAVRAREREEESLIALRNRQLQFLASYRAFLEQELAELAAHARAIEMQAGRASGPAFGRTPPAPPRPRPEPAPPPRPEAASSAGPSGPRDPAPVARTGAALTAAATPGPAPPQPPRAPAPEAPRDPAGEEIDAHVGAALAEWTTEFDEVGAGDEPELILSDADVVVEGADADSPETPESRTIEAKPEGGAEPPPSRFDDPDFREEISAAFAEPAHADDDLLDLDSFDSLRRDADPALGESIVGPPPVIPPDQLTISPMFLERAGPETESAPAEEPAPVDEPSRRDMFSSLFEDEG